MSVGAPEDQPQSHKMNLASQEKMREFCYELALALRRITGKVVENDLEFLEKKGASPEGLSEDAKADKNSDDLKR